MFKFTDTKKENIFIRQWSGLPYHIVYWHMVLIFTVLLTGVLLIIVASLFLKVSTINLYEEKLSNTSSPIHEKNIKKIFTILKKTTVSE